MEWKKVSVELHSKNLEPKCSRFFTGTESKIILFLFNQEKYW